MKKPLKATLVPFEIFLHAFHFHESDHRLRNSISPDNLDQVMLITHPSMVLSAFATELYLKCFLCIETGKVPNDHNLKGLFIRLDLSTMKRLEELWDDDIRRPERQKTLDYIRQFPKGDQLRLDLLYALDIGANAFMELRYLYERHDSYFILSDFPDILRTVILERSPCWISALPTRPIIQVR